MRNNLEFKQTEIGEIPKNWNVKKLSDFCDILMGQSPPSSSYNSTGDGLPFFQGRKDFGMKFPVKAMWCTAPARIANPRDVLLSVRAPVGDVNVAIEKCCIGRGLSALSIKNGDKIFLYYLLLYNQHRLKQIFESEGTVFGCVTKDGLRGFEVALPYDEKEQRTIAKILSDLDEKIELNHQMNKTLEAMGQALFKRWFVDFEFPGYEKVTFVDGLPEGWRSGKLEDIMINFDAKRIPLSSRERDTRKGIYPYYGAASVMDYVNDYIFDGIYVLMGEDGTVIRDDGYPVLQYVWGKFWVNNHAHVLQGKGDIPTEYLLLMLQHTNISHIVTGAVQPKINQGNMNNLPAIIPSKEIMALFSKAIAPIYDRFRNNVNEINVLSQIRDSLLPRLMNGKIRVN